VSGMVTVTGLGSGPVGESRSVGDSATSFVGGVTVVLVARRWGLRLEPLTRIP
jgi:hypothetical protein